MTKMNTFFNSKEIKEEPNEISDDKSDESLGLESALKKKIDSKGRGEKL